MSFYGVHWYPCFGLLVTSPLGFKARVGSLIRTWRRGTWCNGNISPFDNREKRKLPYIFKSSHLLNNNSCHMYLIWRVPSLEFEIPIKIRSCPTIHATLCELFCDDPPWAINKWDLILIPLSVNTFCLCMLNTYILVWLNTRCIWEWNFLFERKPFSSSHSH